VVADDERHDVAPNADEVENLVNSECIAAHRSSSVDIRALAVLGMKARRGLAAADARSERLARAQGWHPLARFGGEEVQLAQDALRAVDLVIQYNEGTLALPPEKEAVLHRMGLLAVRDLDRLAKSIRGKCNYFRVLERQGSLQRLRPAATPTRRGGPRRRERRSTSRRSSRGSPARRSPDDEPDPSRPSGPPLGGRGIRGLAVGGSR
jgi:hypothetical protein